MADIEVSGDGAPNSLVTTAQIIYGLHALSILIGLTSAVTIVGAFVFGVPSIIAVILTMILGSPARVVRPLTAEEQAGIRQWAEKYIEVAKAHAVLKG